MENLIKQLHEGHFSCVIAQAETVRTFSGRGVADLYQLLKTDAGFMKGALVADKVVGKGAAAIMIEGGIKGVYADLMSKPARVLLSTAGIEVAYGEVVDHIENRDKTDWCPLEKSCKQEQNVSAILSVVDKFIANMRMKHLPVISITLCSALMPWTA